MPLKKGPKAAAELLSLLPAEQRASVLEEMKKQNPQMTEELLKMMVTIEDLRFITTKMLQEFLREINIKDLSLALRIASPELKNFFLTNVSKTTRLEIEEVLLGPPVPVSKVQEAQDNITKILRKKIDRGEIIINKKGDEYV